MFGENGSGSRNGVEEVAGNDWSQFYSFSCAASGGINLATQCHCFWVELFSICPSTLFLSPFGSFAKVLIKCQSFRPWKRFVFHHKSSSIELKWIFKISETSVTLRPNYMADLCSSIERSGYTPLLWCSCSVVQRSWPEVHWDELSPISP